MPYTEKVIINHINVNVTYTKQIDTTMVHWVWAQNLAVARGIPSRHLGMRRQTCCPCFFRWWILSCIGQNQAS